MSKPNACDFAKMNTSWLDDCIMYQFYPLGLCGAPHENSWDWSNTWNAATRPIRRIDRVLLWIEQLKKLNVNAVYFSPVLQSDTHGYNTRDFYTLDSRLGSNEDFAAVCNTLHENGIRILFDSLFNHVGRGFWAFRDIRNNMQKSLYIDWFAEIDFSRNTPCSDGFYYKSYEDNWDFPELNLENEEVVQHIFGAIRKWVDMFAIDGLRVGIADFMSQKFLRRLREFSSNMSAGLGGNLAILGETYDSKSCKKIVNEEKAHASTNSELHSSIVNSVKTKNFFELDFTLRREFGVEGIYTHTTLANFLDNHDITRFAQVVQDKEALRLAWGLLFAFPGIPCIYYGSEWGVLGNNDEVSHWGVRPSFEKPVWNDLTDFIQKVSLVRKKSPALRYGNYRYVFLSKSQYIFSRESCGQTIFIAVNASEEGCLVEPKEGYGYAAFEGLHGIFADLISEEQFNLNGSVFLPPKSIQYLERIK